MIFSKNGLFLFFQHFLYILPFSGLHFPFKNGQNIDENTKFRQKLVKCRNIGINHKISKIPIKKSKHLHSNRVENAFYFDRFWDPNYLHDYNIVGD